VSLCSVCNVLYVGGQSLHTTSKHSIHQHRTQSVRAFIYAPFYLYLVGWAGQSGGYDINRGGEKQHPAHITATKLQTDSHKYDLNFFKHTSFICAPGVPVVEASGFCHSATCTGIFVRRRLSDGVFTILPPCRCKPLRRRAILPAWYKLISSSFVLHVPTDIIVMYKSPLHWCMICWIIIVLSLQV